VKISFQELPLPASNRVLAITKRTADLCATQGTLYAAGFELITATNMTTARALIRVIPICGLIVCYHSWLPEERDSIAAELLSYRIPIMRCTGCTGCDEAHGKPGKLDSLIPITTLLTTFGKNPFSS
jgi:hypothetical protein